MYVMFFVFSSAFL